MSTVPVFDFSRTPLAKDYPPGAFYVKVLDDVFTSDECKAFIHFAETGEFDLSLTRAPSPSENPWQQAGINYGLQVHQQLVDKTYRNGERILRFDEHVAAFIQQRLLPYIPEIMEIRPEDKWRNIVRDRAKTIWRMAGVNERLSFLKYGPGHFFKEHCDGQLALPDGRKARVTLQIYLNGSSTGSDKIVGGSTRIWSWDKKRWYDVEPRVGRVLIFQQAQVLHSGEEVKEGMKYALRSDFLFTTEDVD